MYPNKYSANQNTTIQPVLYIMITSNSFGTFHIPLGLHPITNTCRNILKLKFLLTVRCYNKTILIHLSEIYQLILPVLLFENMLYKQISQNLIRFA